jgi:hypothetical protein
VVSSLNATPGLYYSPTFPVITTLGTFTTQEQCEVPSLFADRKLLLESHIAKLCLRKIIGRAEKLVSNTVSRENHILYH